MAKKSVTKQSIQKGYQNYLLEEGKKPETVRIFTKHQQISDDEFYKYFGSLKNIEASIWEGYFTKTLSVV
ncbi:MAG: TetR/AcrR family transcriptional regulator, partial [Crocinitomicaceae bacterium]